MAGRSAELVPLLTERGHQIDVFVDSSRVAAPPGADAPPVGRAIRILNAHEFVWRHRKGHYDLCVYQVGNSHLHSYIWPYLFKYPGLSVLHDGRVHHARAEALLAADRSDDYRSEFAWSHPAVPAASAEFGVMALDGVFYYQWPMVRGVVEASRAVAAHSRGVVRELRENWPNRVVEHIALGEGRDDLDIPAVRASFRSAHGMPNDALVYGVFGGLTAEKRVIEILTAFAVTRAWRPDARLVLAGAADPWLDLENRIAALQLTDAVHLIPSLGDEEFDRAIAATDVTLNLRWPTALETSGPWVRSLALGRATVTIDLPHQSHVPALDPRTWHRLAPCDDLSPGADHHAITVAIDILDLNHSLRLAMLGLARDADLRARLGSAAHAWWTREHRVERMVGDYDRVMTIAVQSAAPARVGWPAHLAADAAEFAHDLVGGPDWRDASIAARLADLTLPRLT